MGSKGSSTTVVNQNQQAQQVPNPYTAAAGQQALLGAQNAAQQPFWLPPAPVAGFSPTQQAAFQNINAIQGQAQPWYNLGGQFAIGSQTPVTGADVSQYYNPMAANVTAQLQNIFGQQNLQNTMGLTQAAGGVGADRIAVGQANMANQQGLAAGQTYANLYQQALAAAQQQKQMQANAAYAMGNLGKGAQAANLQGIQAQLGAGGLQQQLAQAQMMSPYNWLQQQFAYPFQANQYLAGIAGGLGPAMGGQTTTQGQTVQTATPAQPSPIGQLIGLGTAGLGMFGGGYNPFAATTPGAYGTPTSGYEGAIASTANPYNAVTGQYGFAEGGGVDAYADGGRAIPLIPSQMMLTPGHPPTTHGPGMADGGALPQMPGQMMPQGMPQNTFNPVANAQFPQWPPQMASANPFSGNMSWMPGQFTGWGKGSSPMPAAKPYGYQQGGPVSEKESKASTDILPTPYHPINEIPDRPAPSEPSAPSPPQLVAPAQSDTAAYNANTAANVAALERMGPVGWTSHPLGYIRPGPEPSRGGFGSFAGLQPPQLSDYGLAPASSQTQGGGFGGFGGGAPTTSGGWGAFSTPNPLLPSMSLFGGSSSGNPFINPWAQRWFESSGGAVPGYADGGGDDLLEGAPVPKIPFTQTASKEFPDIPPPPSISGGSGSQSGSSSTADIASSTADIAKIAMQVLPMLMAAQSGGRVLPFPSRSTLLDQELAQSPDQVAKNRTHRILSQVLERPNVLPMTPGEAFGGRIQHFQEGGGDDPFSTTMAHADPSAFNYPTDLPAQMPTPFSQSLPMRAWRGIIGTVPPPKPQVDPMTLMRISEPGPFTGPADTTPAHETVAGYPSPLPMYPHPVAPTQTPNVAGVRGGIGGPSGAGLFPPGAPEEPPTDRVPLPVASPLRRPSSLAARATTPDILGGPGPGTEPAPPNLPGIVPALAQARPDELGGLPKPIRTVPISPDQMPAAAQAAAGVGPSSLLDRARRQTQIMEGGLDANGQPKWGNVSSSYSRLRGPQHALGAYGIMDFNLPEWSRAAIGRVVSPQEFLANPQIQTQIYDWKMGDYLRRFGPEGAGRAWLGGEGSLNAPHARDPYGTTVGGYGRQFANAVGAPGEETDPNIRNRVLTAGPIGALGAPGAQPGYGQPYPEPNGGQQPPPYAMPQAATPQGVLPFPGAPYAGGPVSGFGRPGWGQNMMNIGAGILASGSPWPGVAIGKGMLEAEKLGREEFNTNTEAQKLGLDIQKHIDEYTRMTPAQEAAGAHILYDRMGNPYVLNARTGQITSPFMPGGGQGVPGLPGGGPLPKPEGTSSFYKPPTDQTIQQFGGGPMLQPGTGRLRQDVIANNNRISAANDKIADASRGAESGIAEIDANADAANLALLDASSLGKTLLTPGPGSAMRTQIAALLTTMAPDAVAAQLGIPKEAVAAIQAMQKQTFDLGAAKTSLLGSREAQQVLNNAIATTPGWEQTEQGRIKVSNAYKQALQLQKDYLAFANQYYNASGGNYQGVQQAFNATHPIQNYINRAEEMSKNEFMKDRLPVEQRRMVYQMPRTQQEQMYDDLKHLRQVPQQQMPQALQVYNTMYGKGMGEAFLGMQQ
jgi:hypothetical protein